MDWRNIPSLAALRAFEATARHLNFSKAANELNVTHAAIAQHVRALEAEFGSALAVRAGRGVALTDQGRMLAGYLADGFSEISNGVEAIRQVQEDRPLNVSVTPAFASNWLMPKIGAFWSAHPEISLNINPAIQLVDMADGAFDMAIRYGEGQWPGLDAEILTDGDFLAVAHPDLVAGRSVTCLKDVADLPWFLEDNMYERRAIIEQEGIRFEDVNVTLLPTNAMIISGVLSGLGVTLQPKSLVERDIENGNLVVLCRLSQPELGYYLVTHPSRKPAKLQTFRRWLKKVAAED